MKNPVTIITGGAQGIGRAASEYFFNSGHNTAVLDSDDEALKEFEPVTASDSRLLKLKCDISSEEEVNNAIAEITACFGKIDNLVNNAAVSINKKVTELSLEEWNRVIGINLTGVFLMTKHTVPDFREGRGRIVNICSTRAFQSEPDTEAYSASKGGVFALTHSLAMSLGPKILVNSISPGWIDVSQLKKQNSIENVMLSGEDHSQHPAGRVGAVQDVVSMIEYLLSDKSGFITGQNFIIDGGMTRKMIYV